MVDINLHKSSVESLEGEKKKVSNGVFVSLAILVVLLIIVGASKVYSIYLEKNNEKIQSKIENKVSEFDFATINKVKDLGLRADMIKTNINNKLNPLGELEKIEKLIINDAALIRYDHDYEDKKIELEGLTLNFNKVASQMLGLKKSGNFKSVDVIDTKKEEGKVRFILEIKY